MQDQKILFGIQLVLNSKHFIMVCRAVVIPLARTKASLRYWKAYYSLWKVHVLVKTFHIVSDGFVLSIKVGQLVIMDLVISVFPSLRTMLLPAH